MFAGQNGLPDPSTRTTFISGAGSPVQLKIGPGGDLFYVDLNAGSIHRVQYTSANQTPLAAIVANPTSGPAPLDVVFDATDSSDPDGDPITYSWDLNGDGVFGDSTASTAARTYSAGLYTVRLRVTDALGASGFASVTINAGGSGAARYLSDLPFTLATNGWGPVERDRSNGEQGASDGGQITLNGVTYAKGLGVHALSDVRVTVPADCTRFVSSIGIDDESGANGSVQFEVYTGATLRFQSAVLIGYLAHPVRRCRGERRPDPAPGRRRRRQYRQRPCRLGRCPSALRWNEHSTNRTDRPARGGHHVEGRRFVLLRWPRP